MWVSAQAAYVRLTGVSDAATQMANPFAVPMHHTTSSASPNNHYDNPCPIVFAQVFAVVLCIVTFIYTPSFVWIWLIALIHMIVILCGCCNEMSPCGFVVLTIMCLINGLVLTCKADIYKKSTTKLPSIKVSAMTTTMSALVGNKWKNVSRSAPLSSWVHFGSCCVCAV